MMSNVIINKDRWQPKSKLKKAKSSVSKQFHAQKKSLIKKGYSEEEISKIFKKKASDSAKKKKLEKEIEISHHIKLKLDRLTEGQQTKLLKAIMKEFKNDEIAKIKKHLNKLVGLIEKIKKEL